MANLYDISSADWIVNGQYLPGPFTNVDPPPQSPYDQGVAMLKSGTGVYPIGNTQMYSGNNQTLQSLTGTGVGASPYSLGNNLFDVGSILDQYPNTTPNNAPAQTQSCAWYDLTCGWGTPSVGPQQGQSLYDYFTGGISGQAIKSATGVDPAQSTGWLESYFIRGTIIILGFVFVAAGLFMFNNKSILEVAKTVVK